MKGSMLLLGLALENALKGAVVHTSQPDISNGKLNSGHFKLDSTNNHDLNGIAKKLNYSISDTQRERLERLTIFVQQASKYQSALNESQHMNAVDRLKLNYPLDYQLAEALIIDLQKRSGFDETRGWPHTS